MWLVEHGFPILRHGCHFNGMAVASWPVAGGGCHCSYWSVIWWLFAVNNWLLSAGGSLLIGGWWVVSDGCWLVVAVGSCWLIVVQGSVGGCLPIGNEQFVKHLHKR
jgi:hypothetical protein